MTDFMRGRSTVEGMMRSGASFERIESWIDGSSRLSRDEKSALWLYAFSLQERGRQRYVARQAMIMADAGPTPPGTD